MSHGKSFTKEQKLKLRQNKNILVVYDDHIQYTPEFERFAWEQYDQGKKPKRIFWEAGFDLDDIQIIGLPRIQRTVARIRKKYTAEDLEWIEYDVDLNKIMFTWSEEE